MISRRSFHSFTSSFEADDERSDTDGGEMSSRSSDGGDGDDGYDPKPLYPGHDLRPTSPKELAGWYMYGFAAETYVVCGIGKLFPHQLFHRLVSSRL